MNTVLENPVKNIRKLNFIAFTLFLAVVLIFQSAILLPPHSVSSEATDFSFNQQNRLLSQKIEKNLVSALITTDYLNRNHYLNKARQDINILFLNQNTLINLPAQHLFAHQQDEINNKFDAEANFYLEQMRDAVFIAVAASEVIDFSEIQQQSLQLAVQAYQQNQQKFIALINQATNLDQSRENGHLSLFPWFSWCLVWIIIVIMLVNYWLIYHRSATAATKQLNQLEQQLELQNALLSSTHEAIITLSTTGMLKLFSASAGRMFGYQVDEISGKSICQLMPPSSTVYCRACFKDNNFATCHLMNIRPQKIESQGLRKNGETFPLLLEFQELKTAHQHLFIGFIHDLTAEKKAQLKLKHSEATYRAVVENQTQLICRYDADFRLSFVNNAYCHYFKKPKEQLLNSRFIDQLPLDVQQWLQTSHTNLTVENPISEHESQIVTAEGETEWMQWSTHAIFEHNCLVEYQGIGTITTKQKETEIKLLQAKKQAEEANKAKSQFLSNMSHELKTPLNAIMGFSQLLETSETEPLSAEQAECVRHIYQSGKLLLALIADVLDLSKIETNSVKLNLEEIWVNEVILEALSLIEHIAKAQNIQIKTRFDPLAVTIIKADRLRFKQILINLLSNAIKYNSENGTIVLRCKIEHDYVKISVKDSGKGIDESKLMELFQPFNRLGAEKTTIEGTGVGLCIAKNLVERMGGTIGVINNKENGCCFWVEFPIISSNTTPEKHVADISKKLQEELIYLQDGLTEMGLLKNSKLNENSEPQPPQPAPFEANTTTLH